MAKYIEVSMTAQEYQTLCFTTIAVNATQWRASLFHHNKNKEFMCRVETMKNGDKVQIIVFEERFKDHARALVNEAVSNGINWIQTQWVVRLV